jgi:uncharacterized protein with PIN domain
MTWLRKRKATEAPTPKLCFRCGERLGAISIPAVNWSTDEAEPLWLCAECARTLHNDARNS